MFGFFRNEPAPAACPTNPGIGVEANVAFSSGDRDWTENVNVVRVAADAFRRRGYSVADQKTWLRHRDSGFAILPQLVELGLLENGGVRTTSTVQVNHPTLIPDGIFEYQHATGESIAESIVSGFDQWLQVDFVTLLEALRPQPQSCMQLKMEFPAEEGLPARTRRAILGPVGHFAEKSLEQPASCSEEEHPFCPCCLLTNSFQAFEELIKGEGFYGLRLFAARDDHGDPQADCRVNGDDWEPGAQALRDYVVTWPEAGYEFRKQYVVLQTLGDAGQ